MRKYQKDYPSAEGDRNITLFQSLQKLVYQNMSDRPMCQKDTTDSCQYLHQTIPILKIKLKIPPHRRLVATLPCETLMSADYRVCD